MKKIKTFENFNSFNPNYSKNIELFKPVDVKLLRSLDEIEMDYTGEGIDDEHMEDSNLEKGDICQLIQTPGGRYSVGIYNERGNGTTFYIIVGNRKFIENVDFIFV